VELDSALNRWVDSVPDHRTPHTAHLPVVTYIYSSVRWDPSREDDNFFNQSVALFAAYYYIQIIIHRPFISLPNKPSPLSFPSLAICTNAARSCSHVLDIQRERNIKCPPHIQVPVDFLWFSENIGVLIFFLIIPNSCLLSQLELSSS